MNEQNKEIIDGIPVNWSKYKGRDNNNAKNGYIGLCKELHKNSHNLESEYVNAKTKVLIDFDCGHESHLVTPDAYKRGNRCPKCSSQCPIQAKEDLLKMIESNGHKLLSEYVNSKTKTLIDFNCEHGAHWVYSDNYKKGHGCPKCAGVCTEQAKEDLLKMIESNGHKLLSEYLNATTKVLVDFKCGHKPHWISPDAYKSGSRCPKCSNHCPMQAKEDLIKMIESNDHKLLSEYVNSTTKVLVDFKCGHEPHWIAPHDYKSGYGCPYCKNKGEGILYNLLLEMFEEVEIQKTFDDLIYKSKLKYDFYVPKYNLLIELDGEQHRVPVSFNGDKKQAIEKFEIQVEKDKIKNDYAKNNNISLLRIEYNGKIELDLWKQLILDKINEIENH